MDTEFDTEFHMEFWDLYSHIETKKEPMVESNCVQHLPDGEFEASLGSGWAVRLSSGCFQ